MEDVAQNTRACAQEELLLMTGVALYSNSDDIRWVYVGAKCPDCGLVGVYTDWAER